MGVGMTTKQTVQALASRPALQPVDVEDLLVWTYRLQRADVVIGRGVGLHGPEAALDDVERYGSSACGCAAVERIARLGVRVDKLGYDPGALHPDAEVVHREVEAMDRRRVQGLPVSRLVILHAARAERPGELACEVPRPIPHLNRLGDPQVVWTDKGRRQGYCPISYQPSAAMVWASRLEYLAWHEALRLLVFALRGEGRLIRWWPLAPAAPARPWESA